MKIFGSTYEHEPIPGKKLEGIVLRVEFGVGNVGYADLHPWPEYGEDSLENQLAGLMVGEWSSTVQKSLVFASVDAKARRQSRNLLHGLELPRVYSRKIKMKVDTDLSGIDTSERIRLDFNGGASKKDFENWWKNLKPSIRGLIDAIEDPYPESGGCNVPAHILYSDWIDNPTWEGKVVKPSRDFSGETIHSKVFFTHSFNHPIGQVAAIWEAARFYKKYPTLRQSCGFSRVDSKPFEAFNKAWNRDRLKLKPAPGLGFGFDAELRDLQWKKVF